MKFRTYLETIAGVGIFPLVSLIIFFAFFVGLLIYVLRIDKKSLNKMRSLPLNDGIVKKTILSIAFFCCTGLPAFAQETEKVRAVTGTELILYVVLAGLAFVSIQLLILLANAWKLLNKAAVQNGKPATSFAGWWKKFRGIGVALQDEKKILIDGHDYDGIQELDNRMPPWLQSLFITTIIIAIGYSVYYFGGFGDLQLAELENEIAQAEVDKKAYMEKVGASLDENSVTLLTEAAVLGQGKTIFQEKCTACHGADGGGTVGPNLTDDYWLHGAGIQNIFKVIKYGVPEKGMISWEKQLSPTDIQKVASYVISLKDTKPASPKEPQGELLNVDQVAKN
ncbi:cbb3-type cytochrome c oxidase N-terminal domain-containing protein [Dyadobacter aurulentus]|uniref:cbb3-type cytochrome c oxidase N-terminal domain-containing protein n=1 Tax=Dyadobacter sp. UC 10 TaxID=2605428 RepID=UPI0011F2A609|nr:cbb3-type cytochrome c oxidase N-terminal domain-containing protein [Dyadobacter sp. UC 10]KAA0992991.1 c-type cytochrome [Dyadobacter sp. UC 10]